MNNRQHLLNIITAYFAGNTYEVELTDSLMKLIIETTMEPIVYETVPNAQENQRIAEAYTFVQELKQHTKKFITLLNNAPVPVTLLKDATLPTNTTRYSTDLDIHVQPEHYFALCDYLISKGFVKQEEGLPYTPELHRKGKTTPKDILLLKEVLKEETQLIQKQSQPHTTIPAVRYEAYERQYRSVGEAFHSPEGIIIDVHHHLFTRHMPFRTHMRNVQLDKQKKNIFVPTPEDALIIDACHALKENAQEPKKYFRSGLKHITDVAYRVQEPLKWNRVVSQAHKQHASAEVWWYLHNAQKLVSVQIPGSVLNQLKNNAHPIKYALLKAIPTKHFFNKPSIPYRLYAQLCKPGLLYSLAKAGYKLTSYTINA